MKHPYKIAAVGFLLLAGSVASAQRYPGQGGGYGPGPGQGGYGPSATFFVDDDFRGRAITLNQPVDRLGPTGMEDKISSIQVNGGRWLVCVDDDFRGRCMVVDHSIRKLSRMGMDDKISSVRPLPPRGDRGGGDRGNWR
jgi:hypothetical protein